MSSEWFRAFFEFVDGHRIACANLEMHASEDRLLVPFELLQSHRNDQLADSGPFDVVRRSYRFPVPDHQGLDENPPLLRSSSFGQLRVDVAVDLLFANLPVANHSADLRVSSECARSHRRRLQFCLQLQHSMQYAEQVSHRWFVVWFLLFLGTIRVWQLRHLAIAWTCISQERCGSRKCGRIRSLWDLVELTRMGLHSGSIRTYSDASDTNQSKGFQPIHSQGIVCPRNHRMWIESKRWLHEIVSGFIRWDTIPSQSGRETTKYLLNKTSRIFFSIH